MTYLDRLQIASRDNAAFDAVIDAIRADRTVTRDAIHDLATAYIGTRLGRKSRAALIQHIIDWQALDARQRARSATI